jgi:hypothetical protein
VEVGDVRECPGRRSLHALGQSRAYVSRMRRCDHVLVNTGRVGPLRTGAPNRRRAATGRSLAAHNVRRRR